MLAWSPEPEALTSVQIWSRPKWAQVIVSQRKCMQALAERSRKLTQVFNLRLLATPFGQGFISTVGPTVQTKTDLFENALQTWGIWKLSGFAFWSEHKTLWKRTFSKIMTSMIVAFSNFSDLMWRGSKQLSSLLVAIRVGVNQRSQTH